MFNLAVVSTVITVVLAGSAVPPESFSFTTPPANVQCRDMQGAPVDWFYVYKLPIINGQCYGCKHVDDGLGFLYMDPKNPDLTLQDEDLKSENQAIAHTLNQMYKETDKSNSYQLMYNDHFPNDESSGYRGHTKGVQYFSKKSGFWLIHSVPRFAPVDKYDYPESGLNYGQSMLCVSFNESQLGEIAEQTIFMQTNIYQYTLGEYFSEKYPTLTKLVSGTSVGGRGYTGEYKREHTFTSMGGEEFTHFAKHKKWEEDLYADFVAPSLNAPLFVATWLSGSSADLVSRCEVPGQETYNLREVRPGELVFANSKDHSKFAVSVDEDKPWVCIGDINRQSSQSKRAGGTMCRKNYNVWANYRKAAVAKEDCGAPGVLSSKTPAEILRVPVFNECKIFPGK